MHFQFRVSRTISVRTAIQEAPRLAHLAPEELAPGLVSHLDQTMLTNDPDVLDTYPQTYTELRPFVCVSVREGVSIWTPLTSTYRKERLKIENAWRTGGIEMWRDRVCYLNDGANTYSGRNASFIAASARELTDSATRSQMSEAGVAAVSAEIERQRNRRINGRDA